MSEDFFELFSLPRQAAIDEEALKARYHELVAESHPDKAQDQAGKDENAERSAKLNQAWQTLSNPASRVRHLLELADPDFKKPEGALSEDLMQLFAEVGKVVQQADAFLSKRKVATSALAKALLAEDEVEVQTQLQSTLGVLTNAQESVELETSSLDKLRQIYTRLSFLEKWQQQLNERILALLTLS